MSSYARFQSSSSMNASRGTRPMASRTRGSTMSRDSSCSATIRARSASKSGVGQNPGGMHGGGRLDPELPQRQRGQVRHGGVWRKGRLLEAGRHEGHGRVPGEKGAVAASPEVVAPAEVGELPALRSGDEQLAGVRARERTPRPLEAVRVPLRVEDGGVSFEVPGTVVPGREAELEALAPSDGLAVLAEEDNVGRGLVVEPQSELTQTRPAARKAVDHPGPVGGDGKDARSDSFGKGVLEAREPLDGRLPVVGADDHRVALEKVLEAAGGVHEAPERAVRTLERAERGSRPGDVGGVVVVGEVEDEEVEAVSRDEPGPHSACVVVDRALEPR